MASKSPRVLFHEASQMLLDPLKMSIVLFFLAAACTFSQFDIGLTNDTKVLLHYTLLMLNEGGLYERWQEVNPPLIFLLYALPGLLIQKFEIRPAFALNGYALVLSCLSLGSVWHALRPLGKTDRLAWTAISAFILFVAPLATSAHGDREHLLFVFGLPWILQMLLGLPPRKYTAAFAAIGFFLKPYNILICWVLLLFGGPAGTPFWRRVFSASSLIIGGMGLGYIAVILVYFPGYIHETMPLLMTVYSQIHVGLLVQLSRLKVFLPFAAMFLLMGSFAANIRLPALIAFLAACLAVYLLNGGWFYTLFLLEAPCILLLFSAYMHAMPEKSRQQNRVIMGKAIAVILIFVMGWYSLAQLRRDSEFTAADGYSAQYFHLPRGHYNALRKAAGEEFVMLSTTLWASNIIELTKPPKHVFAFDNLWPSPWLYHHPDSPKAPQVWDHVAIALLRALERSPALLVDESPYMRGLPPGTKILSLLQKDARLKQALAGYARSETIDDCTKVWTVGCRFSIWKPRKNTKIQRPPVR